MAHKLKLLLNTCLIVTSDTLAPDVEMYSDTKAKETIRPTTLLDCLILTPSNFSIELIEGNLSDGVIDGLMVLFVGSRLWNHVILLHWSKFNNMVGIGSSKHFKPRILS